MIVKLLAFIGICTLARILTRRINAALTRRDYADRIAENRQRLEQQAQLIKAERAVLGGVIRYVNHL